MEVWEKYKDLTNDELYIIVEEMVCEQHERNLDFHPDKIAYPNDELKQYIISFIYCDMTGMEARPPYDSDIPEEYFKKRVLAMLLKRIGYEYDYEN